jgi:NADPH2 dehydrogenase
MAPLTRFRAHSSHHHSELAIEYYHQRAQYPGTLLVTEATFISPQAGGMSNVPGIYTDEQAAAWKKIVEAGELVVRGRPQSHRRPVHDKKSFLCLQLWALGRAAQANVLKEDGLDVVSASDIPFEGGDKPRPLTEAEIQNFIDAYAAAAVRFIKGAGGDLVEVHSANGYLPDQFLSTTSNARTDKYGGSVENRIRFGLEVIDAVVASVGATKVGIRISPYSIFQGMRMPADDIKATFSAYVKAIKERHPDLAYLHVVQSRIAGNADVQSNDQEDTLNFLVRLIYRGRTRAYINTQHDIWQPKPFFIAGGLDRSSAIETASEFAGSGVMFGRHFISNVRGGLFRETH